MVDVELPSYVKASLDGYLSAEVQKMLVQIARVAPTNDATDTARTWWSRGYIAALEGLRKELNKDEQVSDEHGRS